MLRRRLTCVRQTDGSDCGPACLATVLLHHGRTVGREVLRDAAGTDRSGTNLAGMKRAAEALGFSAKALKGDLDGLHTVPLPAILNVRTEEGQRHFVVLHAWAKDGADVADPSRGVERWSKARLAAAWTGFVLVLVPLALDASTLPEATPPWRRLWRLITAQQRLLGEAYGAAMAMAVLGIASSLMVQHLVDGVLVRRDATLLDALGIGLLVLGVFRAALSAVRQYLMAWIGRRAGLSLVSSYARHILRLPLRFFEGRRVGEVVSRVQDAARVREAVSGVALAVVVDATTVALAGAALLAADVRLAVVVGLFVPPLLAVVLLHRPAVRRRTTEVMEQNARLASHLVEDVGGIETIKHLGMEDQRSERADELLALGGRQVLGLQALAVSTSSLALLVTGAASVTLLWYGSHRVLGGGMSLGQLLFAQSLLTYVLVPLERLASASLPLQDALVAIDRLHQVLDLATEPAGPANAEPLSLGQGIRLEGVRFGYGSRAPVLDGVDLVIPAGHTVALVGSSGSGKSTLLKLLQRFHEPTAGRITVGGLDLRDVGLERWRSALGVVPQDPTLFSGTLRDNVRAGARDASQSELDLAARAAGLTDVLARLPERWETIVGERGATLSGGQRQRVALARALLRRPQVLLLDEATSHLDTTTELALQREIDSRMEGRTAVVVAHRLSTVCRADLIVVLHEGRIVERGTHESLLEQHGRYAELWRAQSGPRHDATPAPLAVGGHRG